MTSRLFDLMPYRLLIAISLCSAIPATASDWQPPRTEFGHPDLQGVWFYGTSTPYERHVDLGIQQSYTQEEVETLLQSLEDAGLEKAQPLNADRTAPESGGAIAQEADHNFATLRTNPIIINGEYRTSQIVSPANGRLPFREEYKDIFREWMDQGHGPYDGPEIRPVSERCVGPNGGPMAPMIGWFYNANMQIVQTNDYVMILAEMNHDARIIPLSTESTAVFHNQWMGTSRGYWDGDTLVVETSGFRPEQSWFAFVMSDQLEVTERFTLVAENEIHYSYTFIDPKIYSEPVTVEKNITRRGAGEHVFEYACHEGNYSTPSILAGARVQELDSQ